jgi:hypothetical protein
VLEAAAFVCDIAATATLIERAREHDGATVVRTDAEFVLLTTLERLEGCPSFADLGRALHISRQGAREVATGGAVP